MGKTIFGKLLLIFLTIFGCKSSEIYMNINSTTSEIKQDPYYKLFISEINNKTEYTFNNFTDELKIVMVKIEGEFTYNIINIVELGFEKDSMYLTSYSRREYENGEVIEDLKDNTTQSDSLSRYVKNYFMEFKGSFLQKHLTERESKKSIFQNINMITVVRNNDERIVLFAVNDVYYSDAEPNKPSKELYSVLSLMLDNYFRYFDLAPLEN